MNRIPGEMVEAKSAATVSRGWLVLAALLLGTLALMSGLGLTSRDLPGMGRFVGRFHMVVLHFPIALLALALALELCRLPLLRHVLPVASPGVMLMVLGLGAATAWLAAVFGWLLALGGGYEGDVMSRHFCGGLITTASAVVAFLLRLACNAKPGFRLAAVYLAVLGFTNLAVVWTGHQGGVITHGANYLTEHAPAFLRDMLGGTAQAASDGSAFREVVLPILQAKCVECHSPEKAKGKLRLDGFAEIMKGGSGGAVVIPGRPDQSELIRRMRLPLKDEDRMPPEGKPQPTPEEVAVLAWWIEAGASENRSVQDLAPPDPIRRALGR